MVEGWRRALFTITQQEDLILAREAEKAEKELEIQRKEKTHDQGKVPNSKNNTSQQTTEKNPEREKQRQNGFIPRQYTDNKHLASTTSCYC